eukprot:TRINITY_DN5288_c0_g1_i1.p1 TRINITY_DN5288_c0_g1~~TRINITY_DN5288_c0_g1_i1.p1  ORF type:complete len:157 (-),score=42.45 TRINITY_DN5288_c0_g1_i1:137-607(-)
MAFFGGALSIDMGNRKNRFMVLALTKFLQEDLKKNGIYEKPTPSSPQDSGTEDCGTNDASTTVITAADVRKQIITSLEKLLAKWKGDPALPEIGTNLITQLQLAIETGEDTRDILALFSALNLNTQRSDGEEEMEKGKRKRIECESDKKVWLRKTI